MSGFEIHRVGNVAALFVENKGPKASALRTWLRRERARENAEFARAMTAAERAASPLHVQVGGLRRIETREGVLPAGPSISITYRIPPPLLVFASPVLPELPVDPGAEVDGDVTVYPPAPRPTR